ncbi:MAG: nucleotidyltransferase domain-containing protein [Candidatus Omnitrophica bacterium]|nr:nucleotidyltransferase domain-containing protein [Candidatus Omnitrophota bacterium]
MERKKSNRFVSDFARLVKNEFRAQKVILFGSQAYGDPSISSDLDILIIMDTKLKPYKQAALIRMFIDGKLGVKYPMDLIVRTPEQIEKRLKTGDFFIKKIVKEGIHL